MENSCPRIVIRLSLILQPDSAIAPVTRSGRAGSYLPITVRARNCIIFVIRVRHPYRANLHLVISGSDKYHIRLIIQKWTYLPLLYVIWTFYVPSAGGSAMSGTY